MTPATASHATLTLVRNAQHGDADALNRLLRRHSSRVLAIVRRRLGDGLRRMLDSGDVLQETLAAAYLAFDRFDCETEADVVNWLAKIAENKIRDLQRFHAAGRRNPGGLRALESLGPGRDSESLRFDPAGSGPGPGEALEELEWNELLGESVSELPPRLREVVVLRAYRDRPWASIADAIGAQDAESARALYRRAIAHLSVSLSGRNAS